MRSKKVRRNYNHCLYMVLPKKQPSGLHILTMPYVFKRYTDAVEFMNIHGLSFDQYHIRDISLTTYITSERYIEFP